VSSRLSVARIDAGVFAKEEDSERRNYVSVFGANCSVTLGLQFSLKFARRIRTTKVKGMRSRKLIP